MKLKDLAEASDFDPSEFFPPLTAELPEVVQALRSYLTDSKSTLESSQTDDTSHSIGGNLHASVSGQVEIRAPYVSHGPYNSSIKWDAALLIGSGIKGSLDQAKRVYHELEGILHGFHVPLGEDHDDVAHFKFDDNTTITINYQYGRNFCSVMYRVVQR